MLLFRALLVFILCTSAIAAPVAAPVKLDSIAFTTSINEAISNIHPGTNHADYLHKSRRQRMSGYWRVRIKRTVSENLFHLVCLSYTLIGETGVRWASW